MQLWDGFAAELGRDLGFRRCGLFYATDNEATLAQWESWHPIGREAGVETRMLSPAEIAERIPANRRKWLGRVQSVTDGKAEPALAAAALAAGARACGATIHQNCAARGLDIANARLHQARCRVR